MRGWRVAKDRIDAVHTGTGPIEADEFVLCAGIWSTDLARQLDLRLPMQAGKGYSLTLESAPVLPRICTILTEAHFATATVRTGLRPCSPDGLPYIGRVGRFANLSVATGHAMMGVSLAPITGRLIAEILSGEKPSCAVDAVSPNRYTGGFRTRAAARRHHDRQRESP